MAKVDKSSFKSPHQKRIVEILNSMVGKFSLWEIWSDFIILSAVTLSIVDKDRRDKRLAMAEERRNKYSEDEMKLFSEAFQEIVSGLERNPDQDFLGELCMGLQMGNKWKGQFFTPYDISSMSAQITIGGMTQTEPWTKIADFACGAGGMLIAYANALRAKNVNYQMSQLFVGQDIDLLAACMCYIQLSLLGCAGYVVVGDALSEPIQSYDKEGLLPVRDADVWFTPMYFHPTWQYRVYRAMIELAEDPNTGSKEE